MTSILQVTFVLVAYCRNFIWGDNMSLETILLEEYKALVVERLQNIRERKILEKSSVIFAISCYAFFARFGEGIAQDSIKYLVLLLPVGLTVAAWLRYISYGDYNRRISTRLLEIETSMGSLDSFHAKKAPIQKQKFFMLDRVYWTAVILCSVVVSVVLAVDANLISMPISGN